MSAMKDTKRHTRTGDERGFTLLIAALVSSLVLALGASIFQIAQKQVTLSSLSRDSQFAFYAADTGAECALYWDFRHQLFPTTTPETANLSCDEDAAVTTSSSVGSTVLSSFQFEANGYCVDVYVEKTLVQPGNNIRTVVHADGFNTSCEAIATSPRALQRSVELHY